MHARRLCVVVSYVLRTYRQYTVRKRQKKKKGVARLRRPKLAAEFASVHAQDQSA